MPYIDPVAEADTSRDHRSLDHNHLPSLVRFTGFCLPGRDSRSIYTVTDTGYDSSDDELRQVEACTLEYCANNHDRGTEEDHAAASQTVSEPDSPDCTEKAT